MRRLDFVKYMIKMANEAQKDLNLGPPQET